ncbi:DUF1573 domain-containing protein [Bremerella volcania]|nr:DUF1573 domain-containing protein [Bremerella volcania]
MPLIILLISVTTAGVLWLSGPFDSQSSNPAPEKETKAASPQKPSTTTKPVTKTEEETPKQEKAAAKKNTAYPIAVTDETSYNFGVLPRFTQAQHVFKIRNEGTAPLELKQGPSSCSCTLLGLETSKVLPGETAEIKLEWTLKFKEGNFSQSAVIFTNDPDRKEIEFVVKGLTETRLGLSESKVVFSSLYPGDSPTKEVLLYSRTLKSLGEVTQTVKASIPGVKVSLHEASPEDLKAVEGRCGYIIKVEVPGDLESEHHVGQVVFTAHPEELAEEEEVEARTPEVALNIDLRVKDPGATFFSTLIDGWGRIKLGEVSSAEGSELLKLNFRVDQGSTPWKVTNIRKYPKFLDVKVVPLDADRGMFQLQIQVPPGAPSGNYYGQTIGHIVLESDHPYIPRVPSENRIGIALEFHVK